MIVTVWLRALRQILESEFQSNCQIVRTAEVTQDIEFGARALFFGIY